MPSTPCAQYPKRDVIIGGGGKAISSSSLMPRLADRMMERTMWRMQQTDQASGRGQDALYGPKVGLRQRGGYEGDTMESSLYTKASLHPLMTGALALGAGLAAAAIWKATSNSGD